MNDYEPTLRIAEILNYALARIKSLNYRPSGRWVFYQVYQKFGIGKKNGAKKFDKWTSRARKSYWNGWAPDTMADSVRRATVEGPGDSDPIAALEEMQ